MDNINQIASDLWKELVAAALVELPLNVKAFYDDIVKVEDPANSKVLVDFKRPSEMSQEEYQSLPAKCNWNGNVKYSLISINKDPEILIRLCHLIMLAAFKLKIFGDDAFGKVSSQCKVGAAIVNHILEKNFIFFPAGAVRSRYPVCVRPLNEEIFKFVVMDLLKCTNDTNVQRSYVGDGKGDIHLAGLGIPPIALTDGSSPGSEILFKRSLHEVKALFDSQAYLKNPSSLETVAAHQEATLLDGITLVANGQSARGSRCTSPTLSTSILSLDEDESSEPKKNHQLLQWPMPHFSPNRLP